MSFKLEHRIGIAAPAAAIWDVLADLDGWAAWNPVHPRASGALRIGGALDVALAVPGEKSTTQRVQVIDWVPNGQLLWAGRYGGGLVRSVRFMEIEPLTDEGCIFSNGEKFTGLASGLVPSSLRARTRQAFAAMGEALKRRVEGGRAAAAA